MYIYIITFTFNHVTRKSERINILEFETYSSIRLDSRSSTPLIKSLISIFVHSAMLSIH